MSRSGALAAAFAPGCQFLNLTMTNVGGQALAVSDSDGVRIEGCKSGATRVGGLYCLNSQNAVITA